MINCTPALLNSVSPFVKAIFVVVSGTLLIGTKIFMVLNFWLANLENNAIIQTL
jgi:hypothetical protein